MGLGLDLHQLVYRGRVNCLYPFKKNFNLQISCAH